MNETGAQPPVDADDSAARVVVSETDLATETCESCGRPERPWRMQSIGGRSLCAECAGGLTAKRASHRKTILLIVAAVIAVVALVSAIAGFSYSRYRVGPKYAVDQAKKAMEQDDEMLFDKYVDAETLMTDLETAVEARTAYMSEAEKQLVYMGVFELLVALPYAFETGVIVENDGGVAVLEGRIPDLDQVDPGQDPYANGASSDWITVRLTVERQSSQGEPRWRVVHFANPDEAVASMLTE
ncbi:MAG: hypothetical protein OEV43_00015 [Coriobacteriia bacterium]|nr:hypothetical protein [Coriobacteriia bacterium]